MQTNPRDWNHAICDLCWEGKKPGRIPIRMRDADEEVCCYCHLPTQAGIYIREDPAVVHPQEAPDEH